MLEQILANWLGDYQYIGFTLSQVDDHVLELRFMGKKVGLFSSIGATEQRIRQTCQRYLREHEYRNTVDADK
jgi:hypothetical protein